MSRKLSSKPTDGQRRYRVTALVTISVHTDVYATSADDAREKAQDVGEMAGFCHACSSPSPDGKWAHSGELDGTVTVTDESEAYEVDDAG